MLITKQHAANVMCKCVRTVPRRNNGAAAARRRARAIKSAGHRSRYLAAVPLSPKNTTANQVSLDCARARLRFFSLRHSIGNGNSATRAKIKLLVGTFSAIIFADARWMCLRAYYYIYIYMYILTPYIIYDGWSERTTNDTALYCCF